MTRRITWAVALVVCAIAASMSILAYMNSKPGPLEQDVTNLWAIGTACHEYAAENAGTFPEDWAQLDKYGLKPRQFLTKANRRKAEALTNVHEWTDYVYVEGLHTNSPPRTVLAYSPPANYYKNSKKIRAVAVFVDGPAQVILKDEWTELMNSQQLSPGHSSLRLQIPDS